MIEDQEEEAPQAHLRAGTQFARGSNPSRTVEEWLVADFGLRPTARDQPAQHAGGGGDGGNVSAHAFVRHMILQNCAGMCMSSHAKATVRERSRHAPTLSAAQAAVARGSGSRGQGCRGSRRPRVDALRNSAEFCRILQNVYAMGRVRWQATHRAREVPKGALGGPESIPTQRDRREADPELSCGAAALRVTYM